MGLLRQVVPLYRSVKLQRLSGVVSSNCAAVVGPIRLCNFSMYCGVFFLCFILIVPIRGSIFSEHWRTSSFCFCFSRRESYVHVVCCYTKYPSLLLSVG